MIDLEPILQELVTRIGQRMMYSGRQVPESVMKSFEIEIRDGGGGGILVPHWLPVLEKGRGPRKTTKDHQLWKRIFKWMQGKQMFQSSTPEGQVREAKFMTWYINKYGNKQFRDGVFVDIYTTERRNTIDKVTKLYSDEISRITMDVI